MAVAGSYSRDGRDDDDNDYEWDLSLEDIDELIALDAGSSENALPARDVAVSVSVEAVLATDAGAAPAVATLAGAVGGVDDQELEELAGLLTGELTDPIEPAADSVAEDASPQLSPLARFRTAPRKPLSVTDLTAGAWCELQYEYTLTRLPGGRRTRTAAMRAGTEVHARFEEEVHTTVRVEVVSREDMQGLKLWNMVQGLRSLRETGLTRELEVWGIVGDGLVVSGVIDALSYACPGEGYGARTDSRTDATPRTPKKRSPRKGKQANTPEQVSKITDFFSSPTQPLRNRATTPEPLLPRRRIYITDIKTRGSRKLPSGVAARPTKIQLFLYHRFLADLAAGRLDFARVFARYSLDPDAAFSDAFLAQMGELHKEMFASDGSVQGGDGVGLVRYGTLNALVGLLQAEVAQTFPDGADSIGHLVAAEYWLRPRKRRRMSNEDEDEDENEDEDDQGDDTSRCIGTNVMAVDEAVLDRYLLHYLAWWCGRRAAAGVDIEEASLKCGHCEFAADCAWRSRLDEARVRRVRERLAGR